MRQFGVTRAQAMRLAGPDLARAVPASAARAVLEGAAASGAADHGLRRQPRLPADPRRPRAPRRAGRPVDQRPRPDLQPAPARGPRRPRPGSSASPRRTATSIRSSSTTPAASWRRRSSATARPAARSAPTGAPSSPACRTATSLIFGRSARNFACTKPPFRTAMSRPEVLFPLFAELTALDGVGPKTARLLARLDIAHPAHLILTLPTGGVDRRLRASVREAQPARGRHRRGRGRPAPARRLAHPPLPRPRPRRPDRVPARLLPRPRGLAAPQAARRPAPHRLRPGRALRRHRPDGPPRPHPAPRRARCPTTSRSTR